MSAIEQAAREAAEAVGAINAHGHFTVARFDRHPDGYLHARVMVDGQPWYFHCRYGSWLAPGHVGTQPVLKEPEGLLGAVVGNEVKYTLAERGRAFVAAENKQLEREAAEAARQQEEDDGDTDRPGVSDRRGVDDAPAGADRLPTRRDHRSDLEPLQDD